jgi:hypothetical protein
MGRARALSRWNDIVGIPEFFRTDQRTNAQILTLELIALLEVLELQLVDIDNS